MSSKRVLRVTGDGNSKYIHKECKNSTCVSCSMKRMEGKRVKSKDIKEIDQLMSKYTISRSYSSSRSVSGTPPKHFKKHKYTSSSDDSELYTSSSSERDRSPVRRSLIRPSSRSPVRSPIRSSGMDINGNFRNNGNLNGNVNGNTRNGNLNGNVNGNMRNGNLNGNVNGNTRNGNVNGNMRNGNLNGNVNGNMRNGNLNGNVNGNMRNGNRKSNGESKYENDVSRSKKVYLSNSRSSSDSYEEPSKSVRSSSPLRKRATSPIYVNRKLNGNTGNNVNGKRSIYKDMAYGSKILYNSDGEEVL